MVNVSPKGSCIIKLGNVEKNIYKIVNMAVRVVCLKDKIRWI